MCTFIKFPEKQGILCLNFVHYYVIISRVIQKMLLYAHCIMKNKGGSCYVQCGKGKK